MSEVEMFSGIRAVFFCTTVIWAMRFMFGLKKEKCPTLSRKIVTRARKFPIDMVFIALVPVSGALVFAGEPSISMTQSVLHNLIIMPLTVFMLLELFFSLKKTGTRRE